VHHDHETGEIFGYTHPICNRLDGQILALGIKSAIIFLKNTLNILEKKSVAVKKAA